MKPLVQRAGVYLATAKETFGIGLLEAMASGVPILGYARGGILDLVQHKANGYLAIPGDIEDLKTGLLYCSQNAKRLGSAGRDMARSYTWERVAEQVASIYRKALEAEKPTVGIVIPTYNYPDKVGRAIKSAISQTYPLLTDIIVVDDGSTDDGRTETVVGEFMEQDKRIRYVLQPNMGVAHARNNGIAHCDTKYVCCLDADDAIAPSYLAETVPHLEADPSLGIAYSGLMLLTRTGRQVVGEWPGQFNYNEQLQRRNQIPTCCVLRRKMWQRLGGYRQRYAPRGAGAEDAEFWLRCGAYGWNAAKVTDKPLFIYSFQTGRVSGNRHYREPDWTAWHPWTKDNQHPFVSVAHPKHHSHPVRQYDEPEVSIITPVGPGHEHMFIDALDSLESQTFRKWEAIVINDTGHSLDLTAYPYVRLIETEGRRGAGHSRNRGISASRAPLFVCLDADDFLQPNFLSATIDEYRSDPGYWIYTDMYISKPDGIIEQYYAEDWNPARLWRRGIASVTCLYERAMWQAVGGFSEDRNNAREDWEFQLDLAKKGFCGIRVPEPLLTYRHGTGTGEARRKEQAVKIVRSKYTKDEIEMACSGCSKRRARRSQPTSTPREGRAMKVAPDEWPLIEYTGHSRSEISYRGKGTGKVYRFSLHPKHRVHRIHPNDVATLLRQASFRKIDGQAVPAAAGDMLMAEPKPKARPKPPVRVEVKPKVIPEVKPTILPMPKVEVPDVNSLNVREILKLDLNILQWEQLQADERARETPRSSVIDWAKRQINKANRIAAK
jgi:glycosyltransferase involved in cell wall biosynthesis